VAGAKAYLRAKFHLDPSNHLATIHQHHRQTGQRDRQKQSDSIGQTILQTVAQKLSAVLVASGLQVRLPVFAANALAKLPIHI